MHRRIGRGLQIVLAALAVWMLAGVTAAAAVASSPRVRVGSITPLPSDAHVTGTTPSTTVIHMTVALEPQDPAGLSALATEVSTPGTSLFRHYLTVPQFAQRFGATPLQVGAVESALRAAGLNVGTVTANDLTLPVTGTAAQVEKAFSVSLAKVKLPNRTAYANQQAPALPSGIAPFVQGVIGLDNVNPDQPAGLARQSSHSAAGTHLARAASRPHVPTGGPQPCSSATAEHANNGLTADEVATAYQFSSLYGAGDLGQGQTVALFEEQPYIPSDIAAYQACYGTNVPITNVDVSGGPGTSGDDGESALDIEQVIGLAPRANILVYQGPFSATVQIISQIVSEDRAKVISSSYGLCEALTGGTTITAESPLLQEAAVQGQSFFISSGDSGSNMCYQATADAPTPDTSLSVIDPGGQPFATGVGGTSLIAGTPSNESFYQPGLTPLETVWNDVSGTDSQGNPHASGTGGGISKQFTMPSYQSGAAGTLGVINSNSSATPCGGTTFCREVPDVAADADPNTGYAVFSSTGGVAGWGITGGTSAAAPLWAAFAALANASSTCRGLSVGFVNPALYHVAGSSYLNNFHDITTASPNAPSLGFSGQANNDALWQFNIPNNPSDLYPLATGYDMATGLGSMIAPQLAASLCGLRSPVFSVAVANPGTRGAAVRQHVSLQMHATDSGGAGLSFHATGLPAGLGISPAGLISGTPTIAGTSTVTVLAGDSFGNAGATAFKFVIAKPGPPKSSRASLGGVNKGKAKLTFTIGAGANAAALKSLVLSLPSGLSFAKSSKSLSKGIVSKGSNGKRLKFKASVKHGKLTITLSSAVAKATVTISRPAINVSSSLASKVRRGKLKKLSIGLQAIDTSHKTTKLTLQLKV